MNHVICSLPHRKRKEKKVDKLSGKQDDVTTEWFHQFFSSSALRYIFWILIERKREKERESERLPNF